MTPDDGLEMTPLERVLGVHQRWFSISTVKLFVMKSHSEDEVLGQA